MNMLEGRLENVDGRVIAVLGSQRLMLDDAVLARRPALQQFAGRPVVIGIRPEDIEDASLITSDTAERTLSGEMALEEHLGSELMVHFRVDAPAAVTEDIKELQKDAGHANGEAGAARTGETIVVGRFSPRSRVRIGERVTAAVTAENLHFFDPDSGLGIYGNDGRGRT